MPVSIPRLPSIFAILGAFGALQTVSGISSGLDSVGDIGMCIISSMLLGGALGMHLRRITLARLEVIIFGVAVIIFGVAVGIILLDWNAASRMHVRAWPFVVLVMDILLLARASDLAAHAVIALIIAWLTVDVKG
eukprot:gene27519-62139_t